MLGQSQAIRLGPECISVGPETEAHQDLALELRAHHDRAHIRGRHKLSRRARAVIRQRAGSGVGRGEGILTGTDERIGQAEAGENLRPFRGAVPPGCENVVHACVVPFSRLQTGDRSAKNALQHFRSQVPGRWSMLTVVSFFDYRLLRPVN